MLPPPCFNVGMVSCQSTPIPIRLDGDGLWAMWKDLKHSSVALAGWCPVGRWAWTPVSHVLQIGTGFLLREFCILSISLSTLVSFWAPADVYHQWCYHHHASYFRPNVNRCSSIGLPCILVPFGWVEIQSTSRKYDQLFKMFWCWWTGAINILLLIFFFFRWPYGRLSLTLVQCLLSLRFMKRTPSSSGVCVCVFLNSEWMLMYSHAWASVLSVHITFPVFLR